MIDFKLDDKGLQRDLERAPKLFAANANVAIRRAMFGFRRDFLRELPGRIKAKRGRFGLAGRKFTATVFSDLGGGSSPADKLVGQVYTESRAALGLQKGGVWRSRDGDRLVIPFGHAKTPTGRVKKAYRDASAVMTRLARRKRLKIVKDPSDPDKLIAYEVVRKDVGRRRGSRSGALPIYVMVREVKQEAVLKFFETWERRHTRNAELIGKAIEATLEGRMLR